MPGSSPEGKPQALGFVADLPIRTVLDVGPGMGLWPRHFKAANVHPGARWDAIEVWAPYVGRYNLESYYERIFIADAAEIVPSLLHPSYDLAIFGDVIEHMEKARAIEMVYRLPWRWALISVPIIEYPQGECEGNPYEAHRHTWDAIQAIEAFSPVQGWCGHELGVFLLENTYCTYRRLPGHDELGCRS